MKLVTIFGGSGFIGKELVIELSKNPNFQIKIVSRNENKIKDFKVLPNVKFSKINQFNQKEIIHLVKGSYAVINLIGILHENKSNTFKQIHTDYPKIIQEACIKSKVARFIHMSSLKSETQQSYYLESKFNGEHELLKFKNNMKTFILKPSIVFGKNDNFINLFYKLIKLVPMLGVISHQSLFQPISVKDLNAIIIQLIGNNKFESRVFNLCGHEKYSFYEILKLLKQSKKIKCFLIKLPKCLELPLVCLLEYSPYKIITRDNLKSLKVDNICDVNHAYEFLTDLEDLKTYIREL